MQGPRRFDWGLAASVLYPGPGSSSGLEGDW